MSVYASKPIELNDDAIQRFWGSVTPSPALECWEWNAGKDKYGYGRFKSSGRDYKAHRVSYELMVTPVPGMVLDHLCRNRACVNPNHLDPVTVAENSLRAPFASNAYGNSDTCKNGHRWTAKNTYKHPSRATTVCKACNREAAARYYAKKAVAS